MIECSSVLESSANVEGDPPDERSAGSGVASERETDAEHRAAKSLRIETVATGVVEGLGAVVHAVTKDDVARRVLGKRPAQLRRI